MIDTNTVSYIVRGRSSAARAKLAGLDAHEIGCISAITEGEIRYGLAKTPAAHALRSAIDGFLCKLQVVPWSGEEAIVYGELRAKLEASGRTLGNLDMLIAAHAIAVGAVFVTSDKAFSQVEDLPAIVNWATDL
ncbi:MAG: type II toxin-antitoxin system VapC family toxin [Acidobacteriaceae bacterium]